MTYIFIFMRNNYFKKKQNCIFIFLFFFKQVYSNMLSGYLLKNIFVRDKCFWKNRKLFFKYIYPNMISDCFIKKHFFPKNQNLNNML